MTLLRFAAFAAGALATGACSTIIEGTSQDINVGTAPPEAACELVRNEVVIGIIRSTPGSVTVKKNKQNIMITCRKEGFKDGIYRNESDFAGASAGNLLLGGLIGIGIDAATGAANKYDGDVIITLEPQAAPTEPAAGKQGETASPAMVAVEPSS